MLAEAISQSATGNSVLYVFCVFVSLWQIPLRLRALCAKSTESVFIAGLPDCLLQLNRQTGSLFSVQTILPIKKSQIKNRIS